MVTLPNNRLLAMGGETHARGDRSQVRPDFPPSLRPGGTLTVCVTSTLVMAGDDGRERDDCQALMVLQSLPEQPSGKIHSSGIEEGVWGSRLRRIR